MLTKFESKSNRVKGLSFHPVRPWIITSLHNGVIQLWDYRMGTLLDRFDEHDGPVRGVDFHKTQPLIVSGGDDYKVKVWDYKLRRCLFTLLGHLDYIRTVQFHNEYPWIVSASDDQTIRVWNWQSRTCISVLTGHNHYVMCAAFHPKEDLIVSASLDQTVRVWDTTGLRKKTVRGAPGAVDDAANMVSRVNNDLFGGGDVVVKYVLEGHDRGVNWASFHPTLPLVISGADDRQVKLWRMNDTKAWEVDTLRGHTNNVSCVIFHPKFELIVSNSEDRSIRVWDISKRLGVQTFRRESDRFWILAAHPEQNLLAAGHDSGMIVFKLERERPAYHAEESHMFYVKDKYLRLHEFESGRDLPLISLRRAGVSQGNGLGNVIRTLQYNVFNPAENNVLVLSDTDGGSYELITFSTEPNGQGDAQDVRRGPGLAAVFIARNRFAVLDKSRQVLIKNFQNEVTKKMAPPNPNTDSLLFAGVSGRVILRSEDKVTLFEQQSRRVIAELQAPRIKYIFWNKDGSLVALMGKHSLVVATRNLEQQCAVTETVRIKSGAWDTYNPRVFIYTTVNHVKYILPSGDSGIVRTLDVPIYLTKCQGQTLHALDREGKTRTFQIDMTEALFKLALSERRYGEVMRMVRGTKMCGQAIIAYLQQKGFPEVALHFVKDNKTRFQLALACGNIEVALNTSHELDEDHCWHQLGLEALRQGNHTVVEAAYQRTKNFERLSFLYLLTGNTTKLRKMLKIAEMRKDTMARFHNSLYLGEVRERVLILEQTGQLSLAYACALTHGLSEEVERLLPLLEASGVPVPAGLPIAGAQLLQPPTPIFRADNWPLLAITNKSAFESWAGGEGTIPPEDYSDHKPSGNVTGATMASYGLEDMGGSSGRGGWEDDLDLDKGTGARQDGRGDQHVGEDSGWGEDEELDLGELAAPGGKGASGTGHGDECEKGFAVGDDANADIYVPPQAGTSCTAHWCENSSHAADHAAAGSFETAMQLLNRQIAAVEFAPMRPLFTTAFTGAYSSLPCLPLIASLRLPLQRNAQDKDPGTASLPSQANRLPPLIDDLKNAYKAFHAGKFVEAQALLGGLLSAIPLVVVDSRAESNELKELLDICREYKTAIRIKNAIAELSSDQAVRQIELSAYFTHCNLQPAHLLLALRMAMVSAFKFQNYITAASFAHRLLEMPEMASEKNAELRLKAQKVLQKSEQMARNEHAIEYDDRQAFVIDCRTLLPIPRGAPCLKCSYCGSSYTPESKGVLCVTCGISQVGLETLGLVTSAGSGNL
jgi:coatomer protein complex subunit alpha (xenin)